MARQRHGRRSAGRRRQRLGARQLEYYRRNFRESIQREVAWCLLCGRALVTLGFHLLSAHQFTVAEYRERFGFNRQRPLCAGLYAERQRQGTERRIRAGTFGVGLAAARVRMAQVRALRRSADLRSRPEARLRQSEAKRVAYASGWQPARFRKVDDRALRRLARRGWAVKRIARAAGLSVDQTRRRLQALRLVPPKRTRWSADRERILALRRAGRWPLEIARALGLKRQLVAKILWQLRRAGVRVPTPTRPRPISRRRVSEARFVRAVRRGGGPAVVARRLGVPKRYVIARACALRARYRLPLWGPRRR